MRPIEAASSSHCAVVAAITTVCLSGSGWSAYRADQPQVIGIPSILPGHLGQADGGTAWVVDGVSVATETCGQVRPAKLSSTICEY
jgi:hypothetical protein